MLEVKSTGSKLLPELLTLIVATFPFNLVTTCMSVAVEGGSSCESVAAFAASVGAFVPVELMFLTFVGGSKYEAIATHVRAGKGLVFRGVWAVHRRVALGRIKDIPHGFHDVMVEKRQRYFDPTLRDPKYLK